MLKKDYFLLGLKEEAYRHKSWIIQCFSMIQNPSPKTPLALYRGEIHYYYQDPDTQEPVYLTDTDIKHPAFSFKETLNLKPGDLPNVKEPVKTIYGNALFNAVALVFPFKDKIDFITGPIKVTDVEKLIEKRLTTDPEYQKKDSFKAKDPIYVSEYLQFTDAVLSLEGLSQLCVPSASERSMTHDPQIQKVRDELLEKYKDQLHDPAVVSKIESVLIEMDKEWIKDDLSAGFYTKDKYFDIVRKKAFLMMGYEAGFNVSPATITQSLNEGWDMDSMPAMVNSLREGSYSRGDLTAQGGYATKIVNRMFQNAKISEEDCGSTLGWSVTLTKETLKEYYGFYYLKAQKPVLIDEEHGASLIGQTVILRTPMFCKTARQGFCKTCLGQSISENESGLTAVVSSMTSQLMLIMMGAAHAKALKTARYDVKKTII